MVKQMLSIPRSHSKEPSRRELLTLDSFIGHLMSSLSYSSRRRVKLVNLQSEVYNEDCTTFCFSQSINNKKISSSLPRSPVMSIRITHEVCYDSTRKITRQVMLCKCCNIAGYYLRCQGSNQLEAITTNRRSEDFLFRYCHGNQTRAKVTHTHTHVYMNRQRHRMARNSCY